MDEHADLTGESFEQYLLNEISFFGDVDAYLCAIVSHLTDHDGVTDGQFEWHAHPDTHKLCMEFRYMMLSVGEDRPATLSAHTHGMGISFEDATALILWMRDKTDSQPQLPIMERPENG